MGVGEDEAWENAWKCICKGIKSTKAQDTCLSVWSSEYYCKYCEPTERKLQHERRTKKLNEKRQTKDAGSQKQKQKESGCADSLDKLAADSSASSKEKERSLDSKLAGKNVLGVPRGNFLPTIKEAPEDAELVGFQPRFNGRHWRLGFPRGNYLPSMKVGMPEDWRPTKMCSKKEFKETMHIQGACPCCGVNITNEKLMVK